MTGPDNPKGGEWTLLEFGERVAGPDLWHRYCATIHKCFEVLDGTLFAMNNDEEALRERWDGLRNNPQSFMGTPFLVSLEKLEAQIIGLIRERLKSGEFIAIGFMGTDEKEVPPRLFRDEALRIWLAQSEAELPDGTVFRSIIVNRRAPVISDLIPSIASVAPSPRLPRARHRGPHPTAAAIKQEASLILTAGRIPGKTVTWERFREEICERLGVKPETRGYGLDTIQKSVRPLIKSTKKLDETVKTES